MGSHHEDLLHAPRHCGPRRRLLRLLLRLLRGDEHAGPRPLLQPLGGRHGLHCWHTNGSQAGRGLREVRGWGVGAQCGGGGCHREEEEGEEVPNHGGDHGMIGRGMEGDWCVLNQLGWIDEAGKEDEAVMTADMASLPTEVTASLSEEAINTCAVERMEKIEKKLAKKFRKCADNYSEEVLNKMEEMGLKIQTYKCFKAMFYNSCQQKVKEEIIAFFKAKATTPAPTAAVTA